MSSIQSTSTFNEQANPLALGVHYPNPGAQAAGAGAQNARARVAAAAGQGALSAQQFQNKAASGALGVSYPVSAIGQEALKPPPPRLLIEWINEQIIMWINTKLGYYATEVMQMYKEELAKLTVIKDDPNQNTNSMSDLPDRDAFKEIDINIKIYLNQLTTVQY